MTSVSTLTTISRSSYSSTVFSPGGSLSGGMVKLAPTSRGVEGLRDMDRICTPGDTATGVPGQMGDGIDVAVRAGESNDLPPRCAASSGFTLSLARSGTTYMLGLVSDIHRGTMSTMRRTARFPSLLSWSANSMSS